MGTSASKAAAPIARTVPKQTTRTAQEQAQKVVQPSIRQPSSTIDPRVTAQVTRPPKEYHRKTNEEWAETLKNISGAISSTSWEGEVTPPPEIRDDKSRHSAQRSETTNMKLPAKPEPINPKDPAGTSTESEEHEEADTGRLTQNQVIALFNLRRKDPEVWDAANVAKQFGIDEKDARDLLHFTRTYTGRMDDDGRTRGYYKSDKNDTVTRFERD